MKTWHKEAEENVIGAVLIDNRHWREVEKYVSASDFYDQRHRQIFTAITSMASGMMPIDVITVSDFLDRQGSDISLLVVGEIAQNVVTVANVKAYAEIVREYSKRRKLYEALESVKSKVFSQKSDINELINKTQGDLVAIGRDSNESKLVSIQKVAAEYIQELEKRRENKELIGLRTGYADVDKNINGMRDGNLVIIAARPGVGKSTFALNVCENLAREEKKILILSLEMTNSELVEKSLSSQGHYSYTKLLNGEVSNQDDWNSIFKGFNQIKNQTIQMCDEESLTPADMQRYAYEAMDAMGGIDCIMVDYLQLANGEGHSRAERVGDVSRSLKSLAKALRIPVIALAQLNRDIEKRTDPTPKMSDLRESGSIEQDADIILFLHREEETDITQVITGKARKGIKGSEALLVFRGDNQRFDNANHDAWTELNRIKEQKTSPRQFNPSKKTAF